MSRSRFTTWFIPSFLVIYFCVSGFRWVTYQTELYPFSPWGMFQYVFPDPTDYDVRVLATEEGPLDEPRSLRSPDNGTERWLDGRGVLLASSMFKLRGGKKKVGPNKAIVRQVQGELEARFLEPGWEYEIVRYEYRKGASGVTREATRLGPFVASHAANGEIVSARLKTVRKSKKKLKEKGKTPDPFERRDKQRR